MDASGAAALHFRLEQQRQWALAPSVQGGAQPPVDPDSHALRELRGGERVYTAATGPFVKRLIGGAWARIEVG